MSLPLNSLVQFDREIVLSANIGELDTLQDWLDAVLDKTCCASRTRGQIAMAAEEIFVNICRYAYGGGEGSARVMAGMDNSRFVMRFEDSGIAFNPLDHAPPDITAPIAGREPGGLGIFIIRKWMDRVEYSRAGDKNQLTLYKTIGGGETANAKDVNMRTIAIVHGGTSTEQAMSTINAGYVEAALSRRGYKTFLVDYNRNMIENLYAIAPDFVWVCVQGKGHGDGTAQAVLDFMGLNYTGTGALGAQIINDKILCKELFAEAGIRTPPWQTLSRAAYEAGAFDFKNIGYPLVAKAPSQGESIGIELIMTEDEHGKIKPVFDYDDPILIEKYIPGHMVTTGLLEREGTLIAFPPMGIRTDTEAKRYEIIKSGNPRPMVRIDLSPAASAELERAARASFGVTRARDYARVDFMVSMDDGLPYALEINAVPGLRNPEKGQRSYFPMGAEEAGIEYDDMIEIIVCNTLKRRRPNCSET